MITLEQLTSHIRGQGIVMDSARKVTGYGSLRIRRPIDEHGHKVTDHFSGRLLAGARPVAFKPLFILFTNRCGSTYIGDLLRTTGQFNRAGEPLNWEMVVARSEKHGYKSYAEYLLGFESKEYSRNGRFALKASLGQYDFLRRTGLLDKMFPERHVIVAERADKISQAVSWVIAVQTLRWTSKHKPDMTRHKSIEYDFESIRSYHDHASAEHRNIEAYLTLHDERYCRMLYEEVIEDPIGQTAKAMRFLGLENAPAIPEKVLLSRQSDAVNEEFRRRFIEDLFERQSTPVNAAKRRARVSKTADG